MRASPEAFGRAVTLAVPGSPQVRRSCGSPPAPACAPGTLSSFKGQCYFGVPAGPRAAAAPGWSRLQASSRAESASPCVCERRCLELPTGTSHFQLGFRLQPRLLFDFPGQLPCLCSPHTQNLVLEEAGAAGENIPAFRFYPRETRGPSEPGSCCVHTLPASESPENGCFPAFSLLPSQSIMVVPCLRGWLPWPGRPRALFRKKLHSVLPTVLTKTRLTPKSHPRPSQAFPEEGALAPKDLPTSQPSQWLRPAVDTHGHGDRHYRLHSLVKAKVSPQARPQPHEDGPHPAPDPCRRSQDWVAAIHSPDRTSPRGTDLLELQSDRGRAGTP